KVPHMARHLVVFVALLLIIAVPGPCAGQGNGTFNQIFVFGDSLSDTGNLDSKTFNLFLKPPKYTAARFTDGADTTPAAKDPLYRAGGGYNVIWHEQLAKMLGLPAASASLIKGNKQNYAYGGATTGDKTTVVDSKFNIKVDNMRTQVDSFLGKGNVPAKGLYILWGGGNDLRNVFYSPDNQITKLNDLTQLSRNDVVDAAEKAVTNIAGEIKSLIQGGATKFLWPDLPPLNQTPKFLAVDDEKLKDGSTIGDDMAEAVNLFNNEETKQIGALKNQFAAKGITIVDLDVFTAVTNIIDGTKDGNLTGYTNVTDPAYTLAAGVNPDTYL